MSEEYTPSPRMNNGWAEYQRLVLNELERHNALIKDIGASLNHINIQLALMKEENGKIAHMQEDIKMLNERLGNQETGDKVHDAVEKYRKWIIGIFITFVLTIAIPLINIILHLKGVG